MPFGNCVARDDIGAQAETATSNLSMPESEPVETELRGDVLLPSVDTRVEGVMPVGNETDVLGEAACSKGWLAQFSTLVFQDLGLDTTVACAQSGSLHDVFQEIFQAPSAECVAACTVFWASYCCDIARCAGQHKLAGAVVHAVSQQHLSLLQRPDATLRLAQILRLPLDAIGQLPFLKQCEWAANVDLQSSSRAKRLALSILKTWDSSVEQVISKHLDSDLVMRASGQGPNHSEVFGEEAGDLVHGRPPDGFTYAEVFAGSSAFSERASEFGGSARLFIESETDYHPLLSALAPDAKIYSDFYDKEWYSFVSDECIDALISSPMCKHLAVCGLLKMENDPVASQLWDIAELAEHLGVLMVTIENVLLLETGDHMHNLLSKALVEFEKHGFVLAAVWRVDDSGLGGHTWRTRPWVILHRNDVAMKVGPTFHPAMQHVPQIIRSCSLHVEQTSHLRVHAIDIVQPEG